MNHVAGVRRALDFIEQNLREQLSTAAVAEAAHFSLSHFHAVFSKVVGCTIAKYIRRRRLALAAWDLALSGKRILDIAVEYRFDSQEAFTCAFKQMYGCVIGTRCIIQPSAL